MGRSDCVYPFAAVVGQDAVKEALLLAAVNPAVGGVLISGEKGTAKSTLVRGLACLVPGAGFVELPLNITEDRLVGSIDIEAAVCEGKREMDAGLLKKADGGFLYVDEVNLLPEHITNILLNVSSSGENIIEREGISIKHPSRFVLAGSMNPEEGNLRPQFLDRFGLYVRAEGEKDAAARAEIVRRRLDYETDPAAFIRRWMQETKRLSACIQQARSLLGRVCVSQLQMHFAAELAEEGHCAGHRAELILCQTARALAALSGKKTVSDDDIRRAAGYALPHRIREAVNLEGTRRRNEKTAVDTVWEPDFPGSEINTDKILAVPESSPPAGSQKDDWQDIEPMNRTLPIHLLPSVREELQGEGKRLKVKSHTGKGRYIRYRFPNGKTNDIALDATIRTAVIHRPAPESGLMIQIRKGDIREKVREQRTGATILFLVDASGSMGARKRMGAVKGAVLAMLGDAYQKRDRVGIVVFRKDDAACVLSFTRSIDLAKKRLRDLKTGGKTPLAIGLMKAYELFYTDRIKNKDAVHYLIVVSDGRANVSKTGGDAFKESLNIAKKLRSENIRSLVLDTENGFMRFGLAQKLSEALGGEYMCLHQITGSEIRASVDAFVTA